jgi:hypothetical protein
MRPCNNSLTRLQRRSVSLVGASMAICASISLALHSVPSNHFLWSTYCVVALIGASPIILTLIVLARYLTGETDEYLRSLVVRSILWGFGLVMVADTVIGYLTAYQTIPSVHLRSLGVLNLELFIVTGAIALRVQLWRNR